MPENGTWIRDFRSHHTIDDLKKSGFRVNQDAPDSHNLQCWDDSSIMLTSRGLEMTAYKLPQPKVVHTWDGRELIYPYSGAVLDTFGGFVPNLYQPGRLVIACSLPQGGIIPSAWLYFQEHPHDAGATLGRDELFELDIFETGLSGAVPFWGMTFTLIRGTGYEWPYPGNPDADYYCDIASARLYGRKFGRGNYLHYPEIIWDGRGNFFWRLNGVDICHTYTDLLPGIKPYLKLSLMVTQNIVSPITWIVESVIYQGAIIDNQ